MEREWKVTNLFIGLVLIGLCSGFPIGLENSAADYHTQFLTGLVGVLLTVCGVVFLAGCLCCQRKNGFKEFHNNPVVASSTSSLDHGHINPIANGEFTIFTPLSPPHHNNNVFLANEQIVGQTEIDYNHADIDVRSWFDGTECDFPRTRLKYIKELGKGWFGRVVEGTAQILNDSGEKQNWTAVAVRILEASATSSERAVFLHDAIIYRCGKHPHILQLLGRSLESVPLLLLQELCPRGDLKKYLRDNRGTAEKLLSSDLPLLWCCQLSSALKHLHDHRLTHPDLASRNCQVVSDLSLKLGDYGLAASLYPEDYYQGAPAVPVRWCAPESLTYTSTTIQPKQITFESNVWSLGVTMWEIYECGAQPYADLSDDDVLSQVLGAANVRLSKPEFSILYTDYIFRLMQLCWSTSESRPSVSQVHLMLTDLMQVYENTKHIANPEPLISIQDFDKRWDTFKPNTVAKTDNHEFTQESVSMADVDLSDITILNLSLNKDEELLNTKTMSPSLNNLHGSLDNLASGEMDSWLQKVATKTGDMSYVRGLSEAIKDLDNTLALENVSSSDSSHQPSPAPENLPSIKNKLEFKLGPTSTTSNDLNKTQNSSLTESMQRTSSESETEDENWRRKIERGAYSEKVHQKSKSVTDLMVLTHIECSDSDSETPLPSLDYRVNYKNVRYAPKQNLENVSLMFGSEGNLLSVHDKFQEELRKLQEQRKDSLLFVPESISHNDEIPNKQSRDRRGTENSSSDEDTWTVRKSEDAACTYVNINPSTSVEQPEDSNLNNKNVSPNHRNPESLIEELSSPAEIKPGNQVYNIFNVCVDANFSPMRLKSDLNEIICFKDLESNRNFEGCTIDVVNKDSVSELSTESFQVPKLSELIQNNDDLMDYIITRYESQEDVNVNPDVNVNISESKNVTPGKELNNNIQNSAVDNLPSCSKSTENVQTATQQFLYNEQENYELPKVHFDISQTQEEVSPSSMTHSSLFTSTPFTKRSFKNVQGTSDDGKGETLQFSSNFANLNEKEEIESELNYSLETWDNFLGTALDGSRECSGFDNFSSQPQSLLFVDESRVLNVDTVECKNQALIESFNLKSENDLGLQAAVNIVALEQIVNNEMEACSVLTEERDLKEKNPNDCEIPESKSNTFVVEQESNKTFVCEDRKIEDLENIDINDLTVVLSKKNELVDEKNNEDQNQAEINDVTVVVNEKDEQLDGTYTKEHEGGSNWEPGEGWFLHPQTEVSGQMEAAQGGEESYVGFSMDDEIMAAIRNELLMKLPQAQGQSSEQVKDSDEWDTEGRSEVLIKYHVYTTPLSPIPEESYSENDSYHFIYNREDSSDSDNEDWPEPYEEHNSGLPDTETRSMQNAESPIPEPQNRHTPSQDSCCSNDTLFNLEELTFVVNENENLKIHGDSTERKGCDLFEANKKEMDKDLEESTLKVEENEEAIEQIGIKETKAEKKQPCNDEQSVMRNTDKLKSEIFTCNVDPVQTGLPKVEEKLGDPKNILENEVVNEKDQEASSEEKVNDTIHVDLEENANGEVRKVKNLIEARDSKNEEEIETTIKTDHKTLFSEDDIVTGFLDHHENKPENVDDGDLIEAINKNVITAVCTKAPYEQVTVSNFNVENCELSSEGHNRKIDNSENIQNSLILEKNKLNLDTSKISPEKGELNIKKNADGEEIAKENGSNANQTTINEINLRTSEITAKKYEVDSSAREVVSNENININDINPADQKTNIHSETSLAAPLEKIEDEVTACKSVPGLEKFEVLNKSQAITTRGEVNASQSMNGLENCEHHEEHEAETQVFPRQSEINVGSKETDLMKPEDFEKIEGNVKEAKGVNENEVAVSDGEVITSHSEDIEEDVVIASDNGVIVSLGEFNNMEAENPEDNERCEVVFNSNEVDMNQDIIISPLDKINNDKSEINLEKIIEVDVKKNEAVVRQAEVTTRVNGIDMEKPMCSEKLVELGKGTIDEGDFDACKDLHIESGEVDQEHKQYENFNPDFNKVEVGDEQSEINIKLNQELEDLKYASDKIDEVKRELDNFDKDELEVGKSLVGMEQCVNVEKEQAGIESIENAENFDEVNIVKVDVNQPLKSIEKIENEPNQNEVAVNKNKDTKLEDICNEVSAEKFEVTNKSEVEGVEHQIDIMQNGFCFDTVDVGLENIKKEAGFAETDDAIIKDKVEEETVGLENTNIGFIKQEGDLTKTDAAIIKNEAEENGMEINKSFDVEEKKDVSINKLNIKNMQNGIIPGISPKWINENRPDLINVFENLTEVSNKNPANENTNSTSSQIKETSQAETNKTCDFPDISLIVENNPNYITEFLNHERQSSISSLGSSRDDDSSDLDNISLQNNRNVNSGTTTNSDYVNVDDISIKFVEHNVPADSASYVNTNELANITSNLNSQPEYVNIVQHEDTDEHLYDPVATEDGDADIYDALADIRFTGPSDIQLMSTSFSESADIDEQDWDSGSDTRSSSSGEFIWKEGEHEESVKALRAAPQDVIATEKVTPMEDIEEVSTESSEDEDGDSPEFVPSAWDKYATPTKSALRSPEKTLEKAEVKHKKSKGVWFKKQKYHCVYEYPREPESPIVNSFDLWQPASTSLIDWEVDTSPYVPTFEGAHPHPECYQQLDNHTKNLYQLTDFNSGMTALDDEFYISSTARPFESFGGLSSQFFPGQTMSDQWMDLTKQATENITPDSGMEDITPSNVDGNEFLQAPPIHQVQPLKLLATAVLKNNQTSELKSSSKEALGGLRHARNKLKLDLPPSPSAFTSTKAFTIEPPDEPVTKREVPTFTTFGKSRFSVQHVDTPTCDEENESKNVSFEALPYKPAQVKEDKAKIEVVRGEASLLDSADEDSGIESSTLERKKITNLAD